MGEVCSDNNLPGIWLWALYIYVLLVALFFTGGQWAGGGLNKIADKGEKGTSFWVEQIERGCAKYRVESKALRKRWKRKWYEQQELAETVEL